MYENERVEEFIREAMALYDLSYSEFFGGISDDGEFIEKRIVEDGIINNELLEKAAQILGADKQELISIDEDAIDRWYKKYPFFRCKHEFEEVYERSFMKKDRKGRIAVTVNSLIERYQERYDMDDVMRRLVMQLQEIDTVMPGTYHKNAEPTDITIYYSNFCHYREMETLLSSFFQMFETFEKLFYTALNCDLRSDQVLEYNFLVSVLGIMDIAYSRGYLYYDRLVKCKELFKKEKHENIFDYIRLATNRDFAPWRCAEFVNDSELVQKYVYLFPVAKSEMREFAINVLKFKCDFVWSDAKPMMYSPEDEAAIKEIDELLGQEPLAIEERAKERTVVYVDKNKKELQKDERYAKKLKKLSSPTRMGGVKAPQRITHCYDINRINARIALIGGSING